MKPTITERFSEKIKNKSEEWTITESRRTQPADVMKVANDEQLCKATEPSCIIFPPVQTPLYKYKSNFRYSMLIRTDGSELVEAKLREVLSSILRPCASSRPCEVVDSGDSCTDATDFESDESCLEEEDSKSIGNAPGDGIKLPHRSVVVADVDPYSFF